jgi:hypothetical protein
MLMWCSTGWPHDVMNRIWYSKNVVSTGSEIEVGATALGLAFGGTERKVCVAGVMENRKLSL